MKHKLLLSEKLKFYKKHMPKNALFEKEENALFDEWIKEAETNEQLVISARDFLIYKANPNEAIENALICLNGILKGGK